MFFRILKKDLKRKKTMNIILLLFIIISAMFAASSVNNIITVVNGIDYYFDKAGMADYYIIALERGGDTIAPKLDSEPTVTAYRKESVLFNSAENVTKNGRKAIKYSNASMIMPISEAKIKYFTADNKELTEVPKGKVYITSNKLDEAGIKIGDKLDIKVGNVTVSFEFAGRLKDALLGSNFMGNPRFVISDEDFANYTADESTQNYKGGIFYIDTSDAGALEKAVAEDTSIMFDADNGMMRTTYIMEVIVAALLMIVGVCLILVSFVVLRFTIRFTLAEEFREIGVMKAIGIKNRAIRNLYLTKYLGISVVGAVIGYFLSIPFGNMMLESATKTMVLGNDSSVLIGIISAAAVVAIIMLFCYGCTRRVNKLSPIDAVRSGQTGERFRKRSIMSLGKSRLGTKGFLPLNDVVSAPRQYGIITLIFTICLLLVLILANTANTLKSDKLLFLFGTTESDLYMPDTALTMKIMGGEMTIEDANTYIEDKLAENAMPAKVHVESWFKYSVESAAKKQNVTFLHCRDTDTKDYVYEKGYAPSNKHEIAVTTKIADTLGVDIGDKVKLRINGETEEFLITALFQSMDQMGNVGRLHQDVDVNDKEVSSQFAYQIDFTDSPDDKTIEDRKGRIKDIFDADKVMDSAEFVNDCTGVSDTIGSVKDLVLVISAVIIIMIAVLLERSFITKEKAEIALMKALGFKDRSIILQHSLRFAICAVFAGILAAALCIPLTALSMNPIFGIMGASNGVKYLIEPAEIFLIYPVIILASAVAGAAFTAIYTKTIKASDTSNIE